MTITEEGVLEALKDAGAILHGHFQLTSGRHSDTYVQCARVLEDPALTTRLAGAMAAKMADERIDVVAAPAVGGIIIGFAVAQALGVKFIFSERQNGEMVFRRSFSIEPGQRVLVVEDVVTTGGSVAEVVALVKAAGGEVAAVTSIIDRGGEKAFGERYLPLLRLEVESVEPAGCAQCAAGTPIDSPGSRRLG
ncbi:MAG TPA: orotate phosphoribosyltransferase [Coriobacteriia bacterium]|uniref:orotate phosphoribosyltransferase n=1 Tax=Anaerosoma tenue TaxID=2933588 RepID=UPI00076C0E2E|nr:orotate phosphoribosyltransferase [Anaerosoma tenue]KUK48164.1 MAG: Orotate phosphoribosyltransferase [Actinobacteria bacterium 66_15]MCK8114333.1 orotate phosphoribosyltransferase [Anaerosoma tenue]HAL31054.1 orotate phosphoribosyltransferase [Coriobacteriia bacterium]